MNAGHVCGVNTSDLYVSMKAFDLRAKVLTRTWWCGMSEGVST